LKCNSCSVYTKKKYWKSEKKDERKMNNMRENDRDEMKRYGKMRDKNYQ